MKTSTEIEKVGQRIGYARVSTIDQNLELQTDALTAAGCAQVYQEKASGKNAERLELDYCLKALRAGDTLVVWRLDRLGRSLSDLVRICTELAKCAHPLEKVKRATFSIEGRANLAGIGCWSLG